MQPFPGVIAAREGFLTKIFDGEESGSLAYKQSVALLEHREHCGNRKSQRLFAVAQATQDLRRVGGASAIETNYEDR